MGLSGYTSLSINQNRYKKIRNRFDKIVAGGTDVTFTMWATNIIESGVDRIDYLKKKFPDLSVIKVINNGLIIEDLKNDIVTKVVMADDIISCSHKGKEADSYILFVTLHPEFHIL